VLRDLRRISDAHGGQDLVLLRYEDVRKPEEWCHRQVLAEWLLARAGLAVAELVDPAPVSGGRGGKRGGATVPPAEGGQMALTFQCAPDGYNPAAPDRACVASCRDCGYPLGKGAGMRADRHGRQRMVCKDRARCEARSSAWHARGA
jgi:hypothetical protein